MTNAISSLYVIFSADTKKFSAAMSEISRNVREIEKVIKPVKDRVSDIGRAMTVGFTLPVVAGFAAVAKAGIDFESAFAGVRKTITASESEFATLRAEIRAMAGETPIAATKLAEIAAVAGQFNVPIELVGKFTKTMADLSITTGLAGAEIATTLAEFINITGLPKDQIDRLGSAITALGNNVGTSEGKIIDFGQRIAGAGRQINLTDAQILGFGGALGSLGIEAESGGTALSKTFRKIGNAVNAGGAQLEQFALVAGMSSAKFKETFGRDSAEAIIRFVEGIERVRKETGSAFGVMATLGITEERVQKALLSAAAAGDKLRSAVKLSTEEFQKNTATSVEVAERTRTTAAQFELLKNKLTDVGIELFDSLGPVLRDTVIPNLQDLAKLTKQAADAFNRLSPEVKTVTLAVVALGAVVGPALLVLTKISSTIIGLYSLAVKAGFSLAGLSAAFASLTVFSMGAFTSIGNFSAAISLIGETSAAATGGLVTLAAAVGIAIGMFINWLVQITGLQTGLDNLIKTVASYVPILGKWVTGQDELAAAAKGGIAANQALVKEFSKYGIAVDEARLGDVAYVKGLREQRMQQISAADALKKISDAAKNAGAASGGAGGNFEEMGEAIAEAGREAKRNQETIRTMINGVIKEKEETQNLVTVVRQLEKQRISEGVIRDRLGKQIVENANSLRLEGRAVPDVIAKYEGLYKQYQISIEGQEAFRTSMEDTEGALRKLARTPGQVAAQFQKLKTDGASVESIFAVMGSSIIEANNILERSPAAFNAVTKAAIDNAMSMVRSAQATDAIIESVKSAKENFIKLKAEPTQVAAALTAMNLTAGNAADVFQLLGSKVQAMVDLMNAVPGVTDAATEAQIRSANALFKSVVATQAVSAAGRDAIESLIKLKAEPTQVAAALGAMNLTAGNAAGVFQILGSKVQAMVDLMNAVPGVTDAATEAQIRNANALFKAVVAMQAISAAGREAVENLIKLKAEPAQIAAALTAMNLTAGNAAAVFQTLGTQTQKMVDLLDAVPGVTDAATEAQIRSANALFKSVAAAQAVSAAGRETVENLIKLKAEPTQVAAALTAMNLTAGNAALGFQLLGSKVQAMVDLMNAVPGVTDAATEAQIRSANALFKSVIATQAVSAAGRDAVENLIKFKAEPAQVAAALTAMNLTAGNAAVVFELLGARIQTMIDLMDAVPGITDAVTEAQIRQASTLLKATKIQIDFGQSVKSSKEAIEAMRRSPAEAAQKIRELSAAGKSATEIVMVMGDEIKKAADNARALNIPLDENTKAVFRQAAAAQRSIEVSKAWREAWAQAVGNIASTFSEGVAEMIFSGQKFSVTLKGIFLDLGKSLVKILVTDAFGSIAKALSNLLNGSKSGSGSIWGSLISNIGGKLAGLFGKGGTSAGEMVLGASGNLGGLLIGGGGIATGGGAAAAGGGAAAGGLGSAIGALASNPITIAAAAAIGAGLLVKHFVGQGRRAADDFVKSIQVPFDNAYVNVVDNFGAQQATGTLTLDSARQARLALSSLISDYKGAANTFGAQGKNESKVATQSVSTRLQMFTDQLNNFDSVIGKLTATTKTAAAGGAGLPQTGLVSSASQVFAGAVDKLVPALEALVLGLSGNRNELPVTIQVQLNVPEIPVSLKILQTLDPMTIRDIVIPEISKVLKLGVRGVTEEWAAIIQNALESLAARTAVR